VRANLAPDLAYLAERPETDEATIGTYPGKPCRGPRQVLEAKGCVEGRPRDPRLLLAGQPTAGKTVAG
jgi:hypothetical protein